MKLVCIGDSITKGTYCEALGHPSGVANPCFGEIVRDRIGADKFVNHGQNGISYSSLSPTFPECCFATNVSKYECGDVIIIAGGTNDYTNSVPLGAEADTEDLSFFGAVDRTLKTIKERNPGSVILVITPIRRKNEQFTNKIGLHLDDYRNAIEIKAQKYSLTVMNGKDVPINPENEDQLRKYMHDGLHPNENGHPIYAEAILGNLLPLISENI